MVLQPGPESYLRDQHRTRRLDLPTWLLQPHIPTSVLYSLAVHQLLHYYRYYYYQPHYYNYDHRLTSRACFILGANGGLLYSSSLPYYPNNCCAVMMVHCCKLLPAVNVMGHYCNGSLSRAAVALVGHWYDVPVLCESY